MAHNSSENGQIKRAWQEVHRELPINDDKEYLKVKLHIKDGAGDYTYTGASFYSPSHESFSMDDIITVNERFASCVSLLTNSIVILVFLRVLCLKRLTSQLLVSLALSDIVVTVTHMVHSFKVATFMAEQSVDACKMTYSVAMSSWILVWTNLSFAVCERLIAINMPNYYSVTHSLISGICNISPWVYYVLLILLSWMGIFEHYIDFGCSNHLMYTPLEPTKMVIQLLTFSVLVIMLIVLIMSRLLHPVYADDALEVNRINLEMKTTFVVLKIAVINVLLFSPLILYSTVAYYNSSETISELKIKLVFYQLAVHANSIPFFVMLRRKEFRKAVAMIFASTASIRKARPMNLLLEVTEARRKKSSDVDADPSTFQGIGKVTAREDFKKIISSSPSIKQ